MKIIVKKGIKLKSKISRIIIKKNNDFLSKFVKTNDYSGMKKKPGMYMFQNKSLYFSKKIINKEEEEEIKVKKIGSIRNWFWNWTITLYNLPWEKLNSFQKKSIYSVSFLIIWDQNPFEVIEKFKWKKMIKEKWVQLGSSWWKNWAFITNFQQKKNHFKIKFNIRMNYLMEMWFQELSLSEIKSIILNKMFKEV